MRIDTTVWFYFVAVLLSYACVGWLLIAFRAFPLVWLGTLIVILHLAKAGTEAIVLANAWVLGVVFTAVLQKTWPVFLGGYIPKKNAPLWAVVMMLLWFLAIAFIVVLAFARRKLQKMGWNNRQASLILVILAGIGLMGGWLLFQVTFPYFF